MVRIDTKYRDLKIRALERIKNHRYFKSRLSKLSRVRYYQSIRKFFEKIKKAPENVKEIDIEIYLDEIRVGDNKDRIPTFETLNVYKNAILCYYNRILKKKYSPTIFIKKIDKCFWLLKED